MKAECRVQTAVLSLAFLLIAAGGTVAAKEKKDPMNITEGVLDEIHLKVTKIEGGVPVVIRRFSTEGAALGTAEEKEPNPKRVEAVNMIQKTGPDLLGEALAAALREKKVFSEAITTADAPVPEKGLVVEGRFVLIDPGSRAKRYWGGFGAGKSGIGVEGRILDATGGVLAEFKHRRHSGFGIGGGEYFKFLSDDTRDVGIDIAKFLEGWATGQDLSKD